jgi:hypothetical protein
MMRRLGLAALAFLVMFVGFETQAGTPAGQPARTPALRGRYAGRPLAEALRDLERKGLRLIYSNDVVRPEMIVGSDPRSSEPRRALDELLHEHHLRATNGPRGSIVIVRDGAKASSGEPKNIARSSTQQMPVALESIVVTPSHFTILTSEAEGHQFLSREEVRKVPHIGDDVYRAFDRLPGITGHEISARFNVRGGQEDEVEVVMDGAEIYDPFHVRDLFRAFSTIDSEAIGAVDVITGGFPLQYGGRLSGVIDISSLKPAARHHTEIGMGILNQRVLTTGTLRNGSSEYLLSFRRGYLHELLKLIDKDNKGINPSYYDLLGKTETTLNDRTVASADVFLSGDALKITDTEGHAHGSYSDRYAWINLRNALSPKLFTQTVVSVGRLASHRVGDYENSAEAGMVNDDHAFAFAALRNDSSWDVSERNVVKAGFTAKRLTARYDYAGSAIIQASLLHFNNPPDTISRSERMDIDGSDLSVYAADRAAITPHFVIEAGLRADAQSYAPDSTHVAPRINASYALGAHATLRASWGRFYQAQGLNELQIEDGVTTFFPAERSDHALLGAEYDFGNGYSGRAEVYDKRFMQIRPRYENIFDRTVIYPELRADRLRIDAIRGSARGGELLLRRVGTPLSGWISLGRASARDILNDGLVSREVPRAWDQRNTATFNVDYRLGAKWNFDMAGVYHSGWPTTPVIGFVANGFFHTRLGAYNSERLSAYRRVDVRASYNIETSHGGLSFFVELFNVLGIRNVTSVNGYSFTGDNNGNITSSRRLTEAALGVVPSFGVTYSF